MTEKQVKYAIILVGGLGTRLHPLTLQRPKQMLPIGHKPMIEAVVNRLSEAGITDVILSLGYKPDAFLEAYPDGKCQGVRLQYAIEPEPLDTAGAIKFAFDETNCKAQTFLVANGDVLSDADLTELISAHFKKSAEVTILTVEVDDPSNYGVMQIGDNCEVLDFYEKPSDLNYGNNINAGIYVMDASMLSRIEPARKISLEREIFPKLVKDGKLFCHKSESYWLDTGTPETYLRAQIDLGDDLISKSASIQDTAEVFNSLIGDEVEILGGVKVSNSAILGGAVVETGAVIENSILGYGAHVCEGASLKNLCVIGDNCRVEPNAELDGVRIPN